MVLSIEHSVCLHSHLQVSIYFEDNEAIVGPVLFITNLDACSWFDFSGDYFNIDIVQTWNFASAG